jgi:hypothetical protein
MKVIVGMLASPPPHPAVWVNLDEPLHITGARVLHPLTCPSDDVMTQFSGAAPNVEQVGSQLLEALMEHPAIRDALTAVLASRDPYPIYLRMSAPAAAEYPWESLFDANGGCFLALESQWPIARIADYSAAQKDERSFAPPLRVLAVLSAVGVDAIHEWNSLHDALTADELDVRIRVVVGQHTVQRAIADAAAKDTRISAVLLEDSDILMHEIEDFDPHVLHLFCHGSAEPTAQLELGTPGDHAAVVSSIIIEPTKMPVGFSSWLAVLNCCEGAAGERGVGTLADKLVTAGYPAVIGMREPIASTDANLFSLHFYRELLRKLKAELAPGGEVEIEWAASLQRPREALRDKYTPALRPPQAAAQHRDWTFPVLYVRPEPLRIRSIRVHPDHDAHTRDRLMAQLDQLARLRLNLHASTPAAAITAIQERINAVRDQLERPVER